MRLFASLGRSAENAPAHFLARGHSGEVSGRENASPVSSFGTPMIHRKAFCACGGGCPRCAGVIQPKLTVGQPNDIYEQEADGVAKQVMRLPEPAIRRQNKSEEDEIDETKEENIQAKPIAEQITPLVQRQSDNSAEEKEEDETVQTKRDAGGTPELTPNVESQSNVLSFQRRCAECEEELHRCHDGEPHETTPSGLARVESILRQPGRPLDPSTRAYFEPRFGVDFRAVRIHTSSEAAESARAVHSLAYTVGHDVVFNTGQYAPHRDAGKRLLAHELTHVMQQGGPDLTVLALSDARRDAATSGFQVARTERPGEGAGISSKQPRQVKLRLARPDESYQAQACSRQLLAQHRHAVGSQGFARLKVQSNQPERPSPAVAEIGRVLRAGASRSAKRIARTIGGEVQAGDRFTVTVITADGDAVIGRFPITVSPAGQIALPALGFTGEVSGVRSDALPSRLATLLSNSIRFAVFVRIEWDVLEGQDRRAEREEALAAFEGYIRVVREPVDAILRYREWVSEHRESPELVTVTPAELWARSLRAPQPVRDPLDERRSEYVRYMQTLVSRTETLRGEERRQHIEALSRFQSWFESHRDDARSLARNPGDVFGGFSVGVTIERIEADVREEQRRRATAPLSDQEIAVRGRKFNEFLAVARQLFGFSARTYPYRIPIESEGRDILVTGDPAAQVALDLLGGQLITWAGQHLGSPDFLQANPRAVLADLLRGPSGQILAEAQRAPLQAESIDRGEIVPERALAAFGTAVAEGLVVIAIVGLFVGAEIITAGQATWLLVGLAGAGGVTAYLGRREEIEGTGYDVPVSEMIVHSAGDVVGVSQIVEAYSGQRLGTQRRLTSVERTEAAGTGAAAVALTLEGSRAFRMGQARGQAWRLRTRGATPPGPEGRITDPLPRERVPGRPQPATPPGVREAAARAAVPAELRIGFDRWMEQIRQGGHDPEAVLGGMRPDKIEAVSRAQARAYQQQVEVGEQAESIRVRATSDPLNPALRNTEQAGNITIRWETTRPSAAEIAQAQRLQSATGEPITLYGDTPAIRSYPGIDGTIGAPPRPLSLKRSSGSSNAGYVRVHAADAFAAARQHGYGHVEVHVEMDGCTLAQVRAGWQTPLHPRGSGTVMDSAGTIARIVIRASDGTWTITPPLEGPALPGVLTPDRTPPATEEGERP